jgi:hypothetical protein
VLEHAELAPAPEDQKLIELDAFTKLTTIF